MKKIFIIAAMAAIVLPLMMSCKQNNPVDDPNSPNNNKDSVGSNAWYEDLITPDDSTLLLPPTESNLVGVWAVYANTDDEFSSFSSNYVREDKTFVPREIMELKADKTCNIYIFDSGFDIWMLDRTVTWALANDSLHFSGIPFFGVNDLKIEWLEKETLVLSYKVDLYSRIATNYYIFRRVESAPEIDDWSE